MPLVRSEAEKLFQVVKEYIIDPTPGSITYTPGTCQRIWILNCSVIKTVEDKDNLEYTQEILCRFYEGNCLVLFKVLASFEDYYYSCLSNDCNIYHILGSTVGLVNVVTMYHKVPEDYKNSFVSWVIRVKVNFIEDNPV